ncbi:MAG: bifunctional demethylmenaquinone methyltransferase/2-methoxy-6-polyprenyl-1,4-benzoquinol methylase UbiE [Bacteroides sp.]|nr:bifunctional demethylmenaquinone methyltransferase/2-methoxy-6-polyprenyl-1,4-benzoquinol methylase UbiE [Bacteroides sp.]
MNPYNGIEAKKIQVGRMFDSIAPYYDKLNDLLSFSLHRYWRKRFIKRVTRKVPDTLLDIATGTGNIAISLGSKMKNTKIVGIDISNEMLNIAREKVISNALQNRVKLIYGDAETLPFDKLSFDAVTIVFGIRNFQNIPLALKETYETLKVDGELYIMEFSKPRNKIFGVIYRLYFLNILPMIGSIISKDDKAYKYLPQSVYEFDDNIEILDIMKDAGFKSCQMQSLSNGIAYIYTGIK